MDAADHYGLASKLAFKAWSEGWARRLGTLEDVEQEALLAVVKALPHHDPSRGKVSTLLWRAVLNHLRQKSKKFPHLMIGKGVPEPERVGLDGPSEPRTLNPDIPLLEDEEERRHRTWALRRAVARLPVRHRRLLSLYYGLGKEPPMKLKEIAERRGRSREWVRQTLVRARGLLKATLLQEIP